MGCPLRHFSPQAYSNSAPRAHAAGGDDVQVDYHSFRFPETKFWISSADELAFDSIRRRASRSATSREGRVSGKSPMPLRRGGEGSRQSSRSGSFATIQSQSGWKEK